MGYDPEYFVNQAMAESLLCPVCHAVYETPMVIDPCGHSFCKDCVKSLLDSGHENCPVCRTQMIEGANVGVPPNRALKELIDQQPVRCMNCPANDGESDTFENATSLGKPPACCSWTGKLSDFASHSEQDCQWHVISCPIDGCTFEGPRWSMAQHHANSVAAHTNLLLEAKMGELQSRVLASLQSQQSSLPSSSSSVQNQLDEMKQKLDEKDTELQTLKARLLDNQLSAFFREWIISKPPCFQDFVVYRPIKYLTGPISQLIVGVPGPLRTDWEGGLYPLLVTLSPEGLERKEPPKCDFPETFFHPNVYEGNVHVSTLVEFEGTWDPSISLQEIFFCIQQLLAHPNHRDGGLYDPEEYRETVRRQAQKYSSSEVFLERAMVELQSKIDPDYKKPLESWENERWENLEKVRWKGRRSFQPRYPSSPRRNRSPLRQQQRSSHRPAEGADVTAANNGSNEEEVQFIMATGSSASLSVPDDETHNTPNSGGDENNESDGENVDPLRSSVLTPIGNTTSNTAAPIPLGECRLCDANGNVCECSCCHYGSRSFIDREHNMRYLFGEGG